jgi:hypothetical protein
MAINSTTNLGLALPDQGEWDGTWGTNLNEQITELIDSAVAGTTTLNTDADVTLTDTDFAANESRQAIILWTASNGATTRNITAPARSKVYVVVNSGTGSIVLRGVGPTTGITIVAGERCVAAWGGSDFVKTGGSPAGSNTQIQFNNAGAFGASANLVWNGTAAGVGQTPPNWSVGAVSAGNVSSSSIFTAGSNYYFNAGYKRIGSGTAPTQYQSFSGEHIWSSAAAGAADSAITFTQVMKSDINNNVKIGTGEPNYKLDVDGTFGVSGLATLSNGASISNAVTFNGLASNSIPYLSGSNVFTTSSDLTYNTTTLAMQTTGTTAPVFDITATNSSGAAVPNLRFIRTTTGGTGTQFVGTMTWRQTQTDSSVVVVGNIIATSNNNPATVDGTITIQAEKEILFQSTLGGASWLNATSSGVAIGSNADATAPLDVFGDTVRLRTARTPASASATGNAGDICWDSNYVYVCVATNTWKRTALSTW